MPQEVAVWLCMLGRTGWEEKRMPATGSGTVGPLRSGSRRRRRIESLFRNFLISNANYLAT